MLISSWLSTNLPSIPLSLHSENLSTLTASSYEIKSLTNSSNSIGFNSERS